MTPNEFTNKFYVMNKQISKIFDFFHPQLFFLQSLPGTNFPPELKNSTLSEPSGTRLSTTGLDGSEIVVGIFKNRLRIKFLLLQVISVGK